MLSHFALYPLQVARIDVGEQHVVFDGFSVEFADTVSGGDDDDNVNVFVKRIITTAALYVDDVAQKITTKSITGKVIIN